MRKSLWCGVNTVHESGCGTFSILPRGLSTGLWSVNDGFWHSILRQPYATIHNQLHHIQNFYMIAFLSNGSHVSICIFHAQDLDTIISTHMTTYVDMSEAPQDLGSGRHAGSSSSTKTEKIGGVRHRHIEKVGLPRSVTKQKLT